MKPTKWQWHEDSGDDAATKHDAGCQQPLGGKTSRKHSTKEPSKEFSTAAVLVWFLLLSRTDGNKPADATLLLQPEGRV